MGLVVIVDFFWFEILEVVKIFWMVGICMFMVIGDFVLMV